MILCTDVGNTNIKFGLYEGDKQIVRLRFSTDSKKTDDELAVELFTIFKINNVDIKKIEGSIISSVVPAVTEPLVKAIKTVTGNDSLVLGPGVKSGLDLRIDNPSTLGSDIVAMCVAVKELYSCPAVIIGLGTATTIVYLNEKKCYCGGAISPGIGISLDALTNHGALLPSIDLKAPKKVISTNTEDCIRSGMIFGAASMLDGMIDRYNEEAGVSSTVIATGGLASTVIGNCKHDITVNDDLVLEGLRFVFAKNRK